MLDLLTEMRFNSLNFAKSNPDFKNLSRTEIEDMITFEIDRNITDSNNNRSCSTYRETYDTATSRCQRNLTIALGASALVVIFNGGMGYDY